MSPVTLVVYSDYLCPWCWNATVRLHALEREFDGRLRLEWKSYLLRPRPAARPSLEKFLAYTKSWERPASEPDAAEFRPWSSTEGPPSHSIPPHLAARAAAVHGEDSFRRLHERLMRAYFVESRDITRRDTLHALWRELALPEGGFERIDDPELLARVLADHEEAEHFGASGAPSVRMADADTAITGAHPAELYRRWVRRRLSET